MSRGYHKVWAIADLGGVSTRGKPELSPRHGSGVENRW